ncbi:MAG: iron-containing alcohol dehydrogenase [bacterium]|nr:iron-containing alcohol dehydrogenase [bacterium]
MTFAFHTPRKIVFGAGTRHTLAHEAAALGARACVLTGAHPKRLHDLLASVAGVLELAVPDEPRVEQVRAWVAQARAAHCDLVIGIGGGSVLDAAKAVAALLTNTGEVFDYLEVIGKGNPLTVPAAPCIAVPTTAGTGAEATCNTVLQATAPHVKVSIRSPLLMPTVALVDPELTVSQPAQVTAAAGMDALTQLLEAFVSTSANPLSDAVCREGLRRIGPALPAVLHDGADTAARADMAFAALCSGMALANARLGAVHGMAGPLGGLSGAPHGVLCARLVPLVTEATVRALRTRMPGSPALPKYDEAARLLLATPDATADALAGWLGQLCAQCAIPPLSHFGVTPALCAASIPGALRASSMRTHPLALTDLELDAIFARACAPLSPQ